MNELFSGVGIRPFDFIQITAAFVLTMLLFFRVKGERRFWPNFMLLTFGLQCMFFIIFHDGLGLKLFAGLMLMSTLIVEALVTRKRKLEVRSRPAVG